MKTYTELDLTGREIHRVIDRRRSQVSRLSGACPVIINKRTGGSVERTKIRVVYTSEI